MDLKRIYTGEGKTPERKALEQETLLRLRRLRAQMKQEHPGVLEGIQRTYEQSQGSVNIPVDRTKNMQTIAAFLKLRGLSPEDLRG